MPKKRRCLEVVNHSLISACTHTHLQQHSNRQKRMGITRKLRCVVRFVVKFAKMPFHSLTRICIFGLISIYFYFHSTHSKTNTNEFHRKNHENIHYFAEKLKIDLPPPKRLKINSIIIRGERHSGTGFLRSIIGKHQSL